MKFREAKIQDIKGIQLVRNSVKENALSSPSVISDSNYEEYITTKGKGWVCEVENKIVGFSIVDLQENNIWALFVTPEFEKKGIGKELHALMMDWYFDQTKQPVWLCTAPNTRAEKFYATVGWQNMGKTTGGEIKFEMTYKNWIQNG